MRKEQTIQTKSASNRDMATKATTTTKNLQLTKQAVVASIRWMCSNESERQVVIFQIVFKRDASFNRENGQSTQRDCSLSLTGLLTLIIFFLLVVLSPSLLLGGLFNVVTAQPLVSHH